MFKLFGEPFACSMWVIVEMYKYPEGSIVPTIREVASLAGVSTATVSHVINNSRRVTPETRARVEQAIAQLGFVPNPLGRLLAQQKSNENFSVSTMRKSVSKASGKKDGIDESNQPEIDAARVPHLFTDARGVSPDGMPGISSGTVRALLKVIGAAQPISRADVARRLEVNRSTVTEIVKPLLASGVLREGALQQATPGRIGRPPIGLSFRAERAFFIGVSIGVRNIQVGAATADRQMLDEESFATPSDPATALTRTGAAIERLSRLMPKRALPFIGVTVPGPTDAARARLLYAPHLGWRDVAVADTLRRRSDKPSVKTIGREAQVMVENDATAAAVYEARRRLREYPGGAWDDFILVRVGTGIGVGLVLGGEVYRGTGVAGGLAGEFGHMTIVAGGKSCACGNRGCWERYASADSIATLYAGDRLQVGGRSAPGFAEVVARAEAGERRAQAALERMGEYLGIGIGNMISGLGVARVVVGGRVVAGWQFIKEPLHEAVTRTMAGRLARWSVEHSELSGAGLGGALEVAIEQYLATLATHTRAAA